MADEIERLLVRVEANAAQFEAQMKKVNKALYGSQYATQQALRKIKSDTAAAAPTLFRPIGAAFSREMAGLSGALASVFTTAQAIKFADTWKQGTNALAAAGVASEDLAARQQELLAVANESRSSMSDTVSLYTRLTIATQELGLSTESTLRLTELLNKSFQSSGKTTTEAASAALQLSQALASGTLQGDELRSLRESAPELAVIIAKAMGVSIGALKDLGAEGKITGQIVTQAILGAGDSIEAKFQATQVTVAQSLTILNNELGRFVGQTDAGLSATDRLAQGIQFLSQNLDVVVTATGVVVTIVGTRLVVAQLAAATAAAGHAAAQLALIAAISGTSRAALAGSVALRALGAASLFFIANPIGLAITAVAVAIGLIAMKSREASPAMKELNAQAVRTSTALDAYESAAQQAANASGAAKVKALEHAEAMRVEAADAVRTTRALLEKARAGRIAAAQAEKAAAQQVMSSTSKYGREAASGTYAAAESRLQRAAAEEFQAGYDFAAASNRLESINNNVRAGTYVTSPATTAGDSKSKKSTGASPEELARQRELLALQMEIGRLEAQGTEAADRQALAKQRELDILNLTKQLTDAGVENAKATAEAHVQSIATAEDAQRGFAILWERNQKALEQAEEGNRKANDLLLDRLGFEAELARLRGDPLAIQTKERELWIEERINALLSLRPGLSREAARGIAEGERGSLDTAYRQGERTDQARNMARDFVDVLASDNWAEAAGRKFRDAAFDNLEDLLATLFSGVTGQGGAGGQSIGSIIGSALRNMIPGFSAGTNSAPGGPAYVHQGEMLLNLKKGTSVVPAHAVRAMGALAGRAQVQPIQRAQPVVIQVSADEGAMFVPRVQALSGQVAIQSTATGVAYSQDQQRTATMRRRQSLIG